MPPETEQALTPSQRMGSLLFGHFVAECVHTVAVLGIADLLASGRNTIETLAAATGRAFAPTNLADTGPLWRFHGDPVGPI